MDSEENFVGVENLNIMDKQVNNLQSPCDSTVAVSNLNAHYADNCHCIPCARIFVKHFDYVQHTKTADHYMMVLATGVGFDEMEMAAKCRDDLFLSSFYYCLICDIWCFKYESYNNHLLGKKHKRMVQCISQIFQGEEEICFVAQSDRRLNFSTSLINFCELCNIQFFGTASYNHHFQGKIHKRVEQFISIALNEKFKKLVDSFSTVKVSEKICSSLPQSYFCRFCSMQCTGSNSYNIHLEGKTHMRIKQRLDNLFNAVSHFNSAGFSFDKLHYYLLHFCEICCRKCLGSISYELHLRSKAHQRNLGKLQKSLEKSNEKKSLPFPCNLCEMQYSTLEGYNMHLMNKLHKRVEKFISELKNGDSNLSLNDNLFETFSKSPYHCGLCDVRRSSEKSYKRHLKSNSHKKIKSCVITAYSRKEESAINVCVEDSVTSL